MTAPNRMQRQLAPLSRFPRAIGGVLRSWVLGRMVPFVGRSGANIVEVSPGQVVVHVANWRGARNHIGGLHACAMALAAETATGLLVGMNVRDDAIPVVKSMHLDYLRRCHGGITAVATLTGAQREAMQTEAKGEITVPVVLFDDADKEPVRCEAIWAWVPKKR